MTSLINFIGGQREAVKQDDANECFHCQFCPMTFGTQSEYKSHTFGHFDTRNCSDCNVHLIKICDEWYEVHSVANCQNNNHIHTFNTNNTDHDSGDIVVVKQEPEVEMGPAELNELLNVKPDVEMEEFGEIFAANLNTVELNENHNYELNDSDNSNTQSNYQVVSIIEKGNVEKKRTKGFECRFCQKVFKNRFEHDSHVQFYHINNETSCKHCFRNFESSQLLNNHLLHCKFYNKRRFLRAHPHRPAENFTCDICGSTVKRFKTMENHMNEKHSSKLTFKCHICKTLFPNRYFLAKHILLHKQGFLYNDKANSTSVGKWEEKGLMETSKGVHVTANGRKTEISCDQCGKVFKKLSLLTEHKRAKHHQCYKCHRYHPNHNSLAEHMKKHDENHTQEPKEKKLQERKNRPFLTEHTINHDQNEYQEQKVEQEVDTPREAEVVIETEQQIVSKHEDTEKVNAKKVEVHLDEGPFEMTKLIRAHPHRPTSTITCDICQKVLSTFYSIKKHMQSHREKILNKYFCSKCKKEFSSRKFLEKHQKRKHSNVLAEVGEAPKQKKMCSICGRLYPNNSVLRKHEQIHSGIMIACEICGKEFLCQRYLTKHIKLVHGNERPWACEIDGCTWRFKQKNVLERHQARLHGLVNNPYPCPICGKEFPNSTYHLQRHLKSHANNTAKEFIPGTKRDSFRTTKRVSSSQT